MAKHISCDCKCKVDSTSCNWNQNGIMKHLNVNKKIIPRANRIIVGILPHPFERIASI